jgi:hypothetical protein
VGQFDQKENTEEDKKGEACKMDLPVTLLRFFPEIHPVVDIQEKADDRDDAADNASWYQ